MDVGLGYRANAYERERILSLEREKARLDRMIAAEQERREEIQRRLEQEIRKLEAMKH